MAREFSKVWTGVPRNRGLKALRGGQGEEEAAGVRAPNVGHPSLDRTEVQEESPALMLVLAELDKDDPLSVKAVGLRQRAEGLAIDLYQDAAVLANQTTAQIEDLIARNARSYLSSRNLLIGVASTALVLALVLGFILSWSVIDRVQQESTPASPPSPRATSPATSTS